MLATYPLRNEDGTLRRKNKIDYPTTLPIFRPWLDEKTFQQFCNFSASRCAMITNTISNVLALTIGADRKFFGFSKKVLKNPTEKNDRYSYPLLLLYTVFVQFFRRAHPSHTFSPFWCAFALYISFSSITFYVFQSIDNMHGCEQLQKNKL